ncbi:hypothetical protein BDV95DRAFT_592606 [Massariosphaeria phaeospora]|uniref:Uncharacterized protein n=1 Tax=Massariosphaeria phaeospora TaxID=100035 RepID=A0A7C8IDR6_9PLEO|nr:hypothetical protein BDV95DRAFT_592606 [Massariosphaeria phaeospora]
MIFATNFCGAIGTKSSAPDKQKFQIPELSQHRRRLRSRCWFVPGFQGVSGEYSGEPFSSDRLNASSHHVQIQGIVKLLCKQETHVAIRPNDPHDWDMASCQLCRNLPICYTVSGQQSVQNANQKDMEVGFARHRMISNPCSRLKWSRENCRYTDALRSRLQCHGTDMCGHSHMVVQMQ